MKHPHTKLFRGSRAWPLLLLAMLALAGCQTKPPNVNKSDVRQHQKTGRQNLGRLKKGFEKIETHADAAQNNLDAGRTDTAYENIEKIKGKLPALYNACNRIDKAVTNLSTIATKALKKAEKLKTKINKQSRRYYMLILAGGMALGVIMLAAGATIAFTVSKKLGIGIAGSGIAVMIITYTMMEYAWVVIAIGLTILLAVGIYLLYLVVKHRKAIKKYMFNEVLDIKEQKIIDELQGKKS